tara:strand:- start:134 stop:397 length:264 start_codon:yes stop_codon:yes gene_type:complete
MTPEESKLIGKMTEQADWNYICVDRTNGKVYYRNWDWEMGIGNLYEPMGELSLDAVKEIDGEIHYPNLMFKDNFSNSISCGGDEMIE